MASGLKEETERNPLDSWAREQALSHAVELVSSLKLEGCSLVEAASDVLILADRFARYLATGEFEP